MVATERHHQDGARNDIYMGVYVRRVFLEGGVNQRDTDDAYAPLQSMHETLVRLSCTTIPNLRGKHPPHCLLRQI